MQIIMETREYPNLSNPKKSECKPSGRFGAGLAPPHPIWELTQMVMRARFPLWRTMGIITCKQDGTAQVILLRSSNRYEDKT